MLNRGSKLRLFRRKTKSLLDSYTLLNWEPIEDGKIKVWIEGHFPGTKSGTPTQLVAIDDDNNEYEFVEIWKRDASNWGFILKPIR